MNQTQRVLGWIANVALYIALLDVAIETALTGSTIRWIVAGIVVAYALLTAVLWKRFGVVPKILASLVVLEIVTAYSGWKLGSLADGGIVLARQPAGVVGEAILPIIFGVAAAAVLFTNRTPLWLRLGAALLGVYLIAPFALAISGGAGVDAALAGTTAPIAHPYWLRGAYLMVEVVLPVLLLSALITAATVAVRRRPGFLSILLIAVATLLAIQIGAYEAGARSLPTIVAFERPAVTACSGGSSAIDAVAPGASSLGQMGAASGLGGGIGGGLSGNAQGSAATPAPAPCVTTVAAAPSPSGAAVDVKAGMNEFFDDLQANDASAARDTYDPQAVVDRVGRDPEKLFEWVRDNTTLVPYQGSLRGPVGVLMDRVGSSLDRALLLADLDRRAGQQVRLARARLSEAQARSVLSTMQQAQPAPASTPPESQFLDDLRGQLKSGDIPGAQVDAVVDDWHRQRKQQQDALDAQVAMLASLVPAGPANPAVENGQLAAIEDRWFVQVNENGAWSSFDPSDKAAQAGSSGLTALSVTPPQQLDSALFHELGIRVVTESQQGNGFSENTVLDYSMRPSDAIGQPIALTFAPTDTSQAQAVAMKQWQPALRIGDRIVSQGTFTDAGLTAVWLEFELRSPGLQSRVIRRQIMDIRGPAARNAATPGATISDSTRFERALALLTQVRILPLVSDISPEFVLHQTSEALVPNRGAFRNALGSVPWSLYAFALDRQRLSPVRSDRYLDRPNVVLSLRGPVMSQNRLVERENLDIVNNEIAVAPAAPNPNRVRLEQGVADTLAEQAALPSPAAGENTADLLAAYGAQGKTPVVISKKGDPNLQSLHVDADVLARIQDDLAMGYAVVAPSDPIDIDGRQHFGWWRVDPVSGDSVGVMESGYHQGDTEYETNMENTLAPRGNPKGCSEFFFVGQEGDFLRGLMTELNDATQMELEAAYYRGHLITGGPGCPECKRLVQMKLRLQELLETCYK